MIMSRRRIGRGGSSFAALLLVAGLSATCTELPRATPDAARREKASVPGASSENIEELEAKIDVFESELAPLKNFILPGGTQSAAALHLARTVCRRVERGVVALAREETLDERVLRYLNRLSDLLFVLARVANARVGVSDVEWAPRRG